MSFDLKIVGGTIVDGTGRPGYKGDLAIKDGKVVALGKVEGEARETIDATGKVVCPGFVDVHTHYDAQILWDRMLTISPWHGVTSVVMGNCGFGVAPTRRDHRSKIMRTLEKVEGMAYDALDAGLGQEWPFETFPQYLDALEKHGSAINVAVLAGHTPIRTYVMGDEAVEREATADEIASMERIVEEAVAAGAIGFATSHAGTHHGYGGNPVPSRLASIGEIDALVGASKRAGKGLMQATVGRTLFHEQFSEIARRHGVTISWTALLSGLSGPGSHRRHLDETARERAEGLMIVPQVACRPIMFDFDFNQPFPFEVRPLFKETMQTDREGRKAIYADPTFRANFKADAALGQKNAVAGWAERAVIAMSPNDKSLEERPLTEVAAEQGKSAVDLALDLSLESDFQARFRFPILNYDEAEVAELLTDPNCVVALSDAGAHASQLCDACFSTHLLGHWVREKGTLSLEQAIRELTSKPAELFGLSDRGLLAKGRPADVVVLDPATVKAGALSRVYDLPSGADRLVSQAEGIEAVVVNGKLLRRNNRDVIAADAVLPGALLRGGKAA